MKHTVRLNQCNTQITYAQLIKHITARKVPFQKALSSRYTFENVYLGFMGYTYFDFHDDFLRSKKLRFGVVQKPPKMQFEFGVLR